MSDGFDPRVGFFAAILKLEERRSIHGFNTVQCAAQSRFNIRGFDRVFTFFTEKTQKPNPRSKSRINHGSITGHFTAHFLQSREKNSDLLIEACPSLNILPEDATAHL